MADDLNRKLKDELAELKDRIRRLEMANPLEAASVTSGRVRFIGGTLRVDSGGRVEIVGHLSIEGTTVIIGPVTISGLLNVTGEWRFFGNGAITGDVVVEGKWTQNGLWEFNGDGDIDGDVVLTGDITAQGGGRVIITGVDGDLILSDSKITMPNGGDITGTANGIVIRYGDSQVRLSGSQAWLTGSGRSVVLSAGGVQISGLPTRTSASSNGAVAGTVWSDTSGNLFRVIPD